MTNIVEGKTKAFTKSDLMLGDVVTLANGQKGEIVIIRLGSQYHKIVSVPVGDVKQDHYLQYYNDDLSRWEGYGNHNHHYSELHIVRVERTTTETLYEKPKAPEKTPQQIELEKLKAQYEDMGQQISKLEGTL